MSKSHQRIIIEYIARMRGDTKIRLNVKESNSRLQTDRLHLYHRLPAWSRPSQERGLNLSDWRTECQTTGGGRIKVGFLFFVTCLLFGHSQARCQRQVLWTTPERARNRQAAFPCSGGGWGGSAREHIKRGLWDQPSGQADVGLLKHRYNIFFPLTDLTSYLGSPRLLQAGLMERFVDPRFFTAQSLTDVTDAYFAHSNPNAEFKGKIIPMHMCNKK